jgi:dGTPase
MIETRTEQQNFEKTALAPYATLSAASHGRRWPERDHPYRSPFQRDRDRVLYSRAFRRLEYKTQVFVNGTADHYRTRLTHTMEMTAVGRTLARALRVNEDLTEAIALAHDIGHSPFGHCGERELDRLMEEHGGFDHNLQSLRWVEQLEHRYPGYDGLNLTWEVRAGLRKHIAARPGEELDGRPIGPFQCVEAQIADVADDIAYQAHDVEDGLEAGLLNPAMLEPLALWQKAMERCAQFYPSLSAEQLPSYAIRYLMDLQVEDVLNTSAARLQTHAPQHVDDVMNAPERLVCFSEAMQAMLAPFRDFLFKNVYWHAEVHEANELGMRMMRRLFEHYLAHPETMGRRARARLDVDGPMRTVCDYVSGMTDRYAIEEYIKFGLDTEARMRQRYSATTWVRDHAAERHQGE